MITFDKQTRSQLYQAIKTSFPDAQVGPADLVALALCIQQGQASDGQQNVPSEFSNIDLTPYKAKLDAVRGQLPEGAKYTVPRASVDKTRYYWAQATHKRETPNGFEPFVGELAMARVSLPPTTPGRINTAIGTIEPADHLIDTVFEANQKYAKNLGYSLERVDCITPTRQGVRFGAVSVLLGYRKKKDPLPSCYILEAGTATGQPKVLYLGLTIGSTINAYSGYQPTPFACPSHAYLGTFTMNGDEPKNLHISSRTVTGGVSQQPYIDVSIDFTLQTGAISSIWPGFLIARAASIVLVRKMSGKIPQDCVPKLPGAIT